MFGSRGVHALSHVTLEHGRELVSVTTLDLRMVEAIAMAGRVRDSIATLSHVQVSMLVHVQRQYRD